ncbi:MAG: hypothetical protein F4Y98_09785, partial [Chloroflexi bacterium]|nr:hypothetical protein [Chloroflexota bacterium]
MLFVGKECRTNADSTWRALDRFIAAVPRGLVLRGEPPGSAESRADPEDLDGREHRRVERRRRAH